ncbi:MAG: bifunctional riboflavin kinase/FAD synthetase [Bacteroidota bacterium]|nr:bifunctional riboflavin kinase/FAD synthetase [Bacteroidota bacterium]MDP4230170.1 bifunctional riboflavin kinase/FAD synthetase [Bacteroidota bacterium]MDP4236637.1 bifunctional riboflavin kinase/FAD synthetase [Bacteroidota bacterium]
MKVTWGLENASFDPKTVTTLGSYDGMHRGHVEILARLIRTKQELGMNRSLVLTFDPHPQEVLRKNNSSVNLLTTIDERLALFEKAGIDEALVIRFSLDFSKMPYNDFFRNILLAKLGTKAMVVGFNHAFGKNREGDVEHLKALAAESGIRVESVPPLIVDGVSISSTKIRHALLEGRLAIANEYLGRPYELTGVVEGGDKIGTALGYPTANLSVPASKLIPSDGVYSGRATHDGRHYLAAISIGNRPTIEANGPRKVEAFLLDFAGNLYENKLRLEFHSYLRPQATFDTLEELKTQIEEDVKKVRVATTK